MQLHLRPRLIIRIRRIFSRHRLNRLRPGLNRLRPGLPVRFLRNLGNLIHNRILNIHLDLNTNNRLPRGSSLRCLVRHIDNHLHNHNHMPFPDFLTCLVFKHTRVQGLSLTTRPNGRVEVEMGEMEEGMLSR